MGWRNDTIDFQGPLILTFKFDQVRNFSKVYINCNNMFTKDVRVFKMAMVYFSVGGNLFQNQPVKYDFIRDNVVEYSRPVMIRLNQNIGRYVRMQLYFDAKWIMISEVQFVSGKGLNIYTCTLSKTVISELVICTDLIQNSAKPLHMQYCCLLFSLQMLV